MNREVIYNAEPAGYSPRAKALWDSVGDYYASSLDDPAMADVRASTTILIVRLGRRIDGAVLDAFPKLRWLVSATTGLDHVDQETLEKRGVELISLRGETEFLGTIPSTAEHTIALLLALLRRLPAAAASVAAGEWQRDRFRGRQLKGRNLGLVGLGRTGRMVAGYAEAFGMRVGYYDPYVADPGRRRFESLHELLRNSEIVSMHVHLDEATRGMVGAAELAQMPMGGWLLNTSRGALLDESAVVASLRSGHLAGVAVDVLDGELSGVTGNPLWRAAREGLPVLITPHVGGATTDAMHQCEEFIAHRAVLLVVGAVPGSQS